MSPKHNFVTTAWIAVSPSLITHPAEPDSDPFAIHSFYSCHMWVFSFDPWSSPEALLTADRFLQSDFLRVSGAMMDERRGCVPDATTARHGSPLLHFYFRALCADVGGYFSFCRLCGKED